LLSRGLENAPAILDLELKKIRAEKYHDCSNVIVFAKPALRFQITPVKERFREAPFSFWISFDGRPNRRTKVNAA